MGHDLERVCKWSVEGALYCDSIGLQIDAAIFCYRNRKVLLTNPMVKLLVDKALKQTSYITINETLWLPSTWDNMWH